MTGAPSVAPSGGELELLAIEVITGRDGRKSTSDAAIDDRTARELEGLVRIEKVVDGAARGCRNDITAASSGIHSGAAA